MRISPSVLLLAVSSLALLLATSGCSDPNKEAKKQIQAKGYSLTPSDLLAAASTGDVEAIEMFAQAGIDLDATDEHGNTALIKAASAGHAKVVERLLGLGSDPRHVNTVKRDALITAAARGHDEVARILISRGAELSLTDEEGWSALSIAAYNGHTDVVSLLAGQASPADLDDALLVTSFNGDPGVINVLLNNGANINARSPENKTPLMIAATSGKTEIARVLLQNQANPFAVDSSNHTAAALAEEAGHLKVKELILTPDDWGSSPEGEAIVQEMAAAREALQKGGVEEVLDVPTITSKASEPQSLAAAPAQQTTAPAAVSPAAPEQAPAPSQPAPVAAAPASASPAAPEAPVMAAAPANTAGQEAAPPATLEKPTHHQIRIEAKNKPIVALQGSVLKSRTPAEAPVQSMVLAAYHEESLPFIVEGVDGRRASVRRLDTGNPEAMEVPTGSVIPGTSYEVTEVSRKFVSSKEGRGRMVDVSRVRIEDPNAGTSHLLVKDVAGQSSDTYAILTAPGSQYRYVVKAGDTFQSSDPVQGPRDYQVLDVRASGVVVKDLGSGEVITIARDGVVAP